MEAFQQLGEEGPQYRTAWVMKQMGRAFFEMTNYEMAGLAFQSALQRDPHNLEVVLIKYTSETPFEIGVKHMVQLMQA